MVQSAFAISLKPHGVPGPFSLREPPQVKAGAPLQDILEAVGHSRTDEKLFLKNLTTIKKVLTETYKLKFRQTISRKSNMCTERSGTKTSNCVSLRLVGQCLELSNLRRDAA